MTPSGAEFGIRRIMVALDGSAHASGAPEAAAALAARLHAELEGVFVQDIDLARLAALPIGREIQFLTGRGRDFTADELDAHNVEQEACARRAIAAAAARARVGLRVSGGARPGPCRGPQRRRPGRPADRRHRQRVAGRAGAAWRNGPGGGRARPAFGHDLEARDPRDRPPAGLP